jgi:hypothetical protein
MNHYVLKFSFILLTIFSITVNARTLTKQDVPEKVFDYIYHKHPKAQDISIEEKTHFGQALYEVTFTAEHKDLNGQVYQEKTVDLFRVNGHFYVNAMVVQHEAFNIIPTATVKSLQLNYPKYEILAMKTVANPNGVGEEYEIDLLVSGKIWNISIDDQGKIISETGQDQ